MTTKDGFILAMQRIPRGREEKETIAPKQVVFLQHGILADATNWVMDTPTRSLAYILADQGFDVWLGNNRGNDYSKRHVKYHPYQWQFWNWRSACENVPLPSYVLNYKRRIVEGSKWDFFFAAILGPIFPSILL